MTAYKLNAIIVASIDAQRLEAEIAEALDAFGLDPLIVECESLIDDEVPEWPPRIDDAEAEELGLIVENWMNWTGSNEE